MLQDDLDPRRVGHKTDALVRVLPLAVDPDRQTVATHR